MFNLVVIVDVIVVGLEFCVCIEGLIFGFIVVGFFDVSMVVFLLDLGDYEVVLIIVRDFGIFFVSMFICIFVFYIVIVLLILIFSDFGFVVMVLILVCFVLWFFFCWV